MRPSDEPVLRGLHLEFPVCFDYQGSASRRSWSEAKSVFA